MRESSSAASESQGETGGWGLFWELDGVRSRDGNGATKKLSASHSNGLSMHMLSSVSLVSRINGITGKSMILPFLLPLINPNWAILKINGLSDTLII